MTGYDKATANVMIPSYSATVLASNISVTRQQILNSVIEPAVFVWWQSRW